MARSGSGSTGRCSAMVQLYCSARPSSCLSPLNGCGGTSIPSPKQTVKSAAPSRKCSGQSAGRSDSTAGQTQTSTGLTTTAVTSKFLGWVDSRLCWIALTSWQPRFQNSPAKCWISLPVQAGTTYYLDAGCYVWSARKTRGFNLVQSAVTSRGGISESGSTPIARERIAGRIERLGRNRSRTSQST